LNLELKHFYLIHHVSSHKYNMKESFVSLYEEEKKVGGTVGVGWRMREERE